ncbi:MAG: sigma 54-interacting transcriptional regulator [Myxococcales bacterium]|nr:sigma 54-interacting transcriptional regulator [Myxococcales bacterium]
MLPLDAPLLPGPVSTTLVGREAELAVLRDLTAASANGGRAVLVSGPAGVGRSRLIAELKRGFREAGRPVLEGSCHRTDHRPHGPLVDLLGSAAVLLADLGRPRPRLDRALELMAGYGAGTPADAERVLLFRETIRLALLEVSAVRAPLLCLHDLHLAHPGTRGLVRYLIENLLTDPAFEWTPEAEVRGRAFRGLFALTCRDGPALPPLLEVARASETVRHLPLAPLDAEGVRAFLQSDQVVQRLLAASGGLPAALGQLVEGLPQDVEKVWEERLERVPAEARPLVDALAVLRMPATVEEAAEVAGAGEGGFAALQALVELGLLDRALQGGGARFCFRREEVRELYQRRMDPARSAALHRRAAELYAASARGSAAEVVARHAIAGGAPADAVPFALVAADHLRRACAPERAAALLEAVVDAAEGELAVEIRDRLAALYRESGAGQRERGALSWLAAHGPEAGRASVALRLAELEARLGDHAAAARIALEALASAPGPDLTRRLAAVVAEAAYQQGDLEAASERAAATLAADADAVDAPALSLRNTLGKVHLAREALDEAQALFTRNLEAARTLGDPVQEARAQTNLGVVSLQRGDQDAAHGMFEATRRLAAAHGDLRHLALSVENLGVLFHRQKDFPRALHFYHQSTAAFRQLGHRRQLATTALNLADLYLTLGDPPRARRLAHIAGDLIEQGSFRHLAAQQRMLEGDLAREAGDLDRAAEHYRGAEALLERGGSNQRQGPLWWAQAELALDRGEPQAALEAIARAQALPGSQADAFGARLRLTRGAALIALGEPEAALTDLGTAVARAEELGDREMAWQALARVADAHWARQDRAATLQTLAEAVETIEGVAAELPASLRTGYLAATGRRAVRDALRRVRAGIAPRGPGLAETSAPLRRSVGDYKPEWATRYADIIGRSPALFPVLNALDRVAGSDSMVLIRGESGTGKELVAAALHAGSGRCQGPFVKVNCSAFVETLLLSELFGHEKGSFTGAVAAKKGRFELADGGTLFLDEIGDISPNTQVALLRVLQEGTFERVGGTQMLAVDVRVICATHRDLEAMVEQGTFRADLYYRLRGVIIENPPLRDRREDIPLLVEHFLEKRSQSGRPRLRFSRPALASLLQHQWPGNVRELENVVRSVALFADGDRIGLAELAELGDIFRPPDEAALLALSEAEVAEVAEAPDVAPAVRAEAPSLGAAAAAPPGEEAVFDEAWLERMLAEEGSLSEVKRRIEFEAISRALRAADGNITRAAERLGMKRPRLSQIIHGSPALGELKREVSGE